VSLWFNIFYHATCVGRTISTRLNSDRLRSIVPNSWPLRGRSIIDEQTKIVHDAYDYITEADLFDCIIGVCSTIQSTITKHCSMSATLSWIKSAARAFRTEFNTTFAFSSREWALPLQVLDEGESRSRSSWPCEPRRTTRVTQGVDSVDMSEKQIQMEMQGYKHNRRQASHQYFSQNIL